ncbi:MAG: PKD domain-containing protein, partial [Verrucomicrobia bacterium]|nr:PKD domain-containing protein [Verrucomicrobiota bacterium]
LGWMAGAADLDGNPRVVGASVDIGAYEYQVLTDPLAVEISAEDLQAVVGFALPFAGRVVGNAQGYVWRFGDGHGVTNQLYVTNTYAAAGLYEVTLTASNLAGSVAVTAVVEIVGAGYAYYVATNGSDAAAGTNWATATATIQAAADVAGRGCVIWVTNGLYDAGGRRVAGGLLTNRVVLDKPLFLRSVNGPAVTCIAGAPNAHDALDGAAAVRGVYLDSQAMLDGFTVSNGHTRLAGDVALDRSGGGVYCASTSAVITNCVITDSTAGYSGGGCYKGTRLHCTVQNNAATNYGGGVYSGVLEYCLVAGNRAGDGGGLASSPALNCVIRGNTANRYGGGAYSASSYLRNCTVAGNTAGDRAGGVYRVPLQNSLVYYNDAPSYPNFYEGGFTNCCTTPAPVGSDNITNAPGLVSALDPRLLPGAACIGRGTNQSWMSGAVDLDDYPRLTGTSVDIGAYEYYSDTVLTGLLTAAISCAYTQAPAGFELEFEALITGRAQGMEWDFGDGGRATGVCVVGHAFGAAGVFPVVLAVSNLSGAVAATAEVTIVAQDCHLYVHPGGDDGAAGTNWATALATIQAVVDASSLGCTIWVSNGTYATGGRAVQAGLTNRVAVDQAVIVRSLNGPAVTAIVGQPCPTNGGAGAGAVRCVYLGSGARLDGFTLTNGFTLSSGTEQQQGGGIWCEGTSAVVTNCRIAGCGAGDDGGGGYSGTFESCTFDGNRADHGGGAVAATLGDCTVTNNRAGLGGGAYGCTLTDSRICNNAATNTYGGGVYGGTASACLLSGNTAANSGGGAYNAQLSGCTLRSNALTAAMGDGGGAYGGTLQGCDLANNSAPGGFGGGAALADLSGCTLVSNSALYGGGAYEGNLTNCLLRWNDAPYGGGAYDSVSYNSTFHNNTASNGAGLFDGTAYDTVFSNNTAIAGGGGACAATLHRCRLVGNTANEGGGAGGGTLYTCVVMDNTADMGGGVASAESYNCTIVGNEATSFGGGTFWGTPRNCIVYYNTAFASVNAYFGWLTNCCSSPLPDGTDNFITAPRMVDYANGDVRLLSNSPCINTGTNQAWMAGARDPDGNHRVILKVVDVGAYEYTYPGMDHDGDGIETAYESGTGAYVGSEDTGTDPLVSDTDGDRVGDGDELTAGTDPTEGASFLGMLLPATQEIAEGFVVSWQSVGGKYYRLERSTNLASAFDFVVQSNIPATPVMNTVTDTTASGWGPYFYRAGVEP